MKSVTFRELEARDLPRIKKLIAEVWEWEDLIDDQDILDATIGLYFNQVLFSSTFGKVAILNDEVIGFIFGLFNNDTPKFRMLLEDGTEHALTLLGAPYEVQQIIYQVLDGINSTYEQLISGKEENYDGALEFFVVSSKAQGLGVGKHLWQTLKSYLNKKGAKSIYAYTDTDCNYGFYEHAGFKKLAEQELTCDLGDETWTVDILLYDYLIT